MLFSLSYSTSLMNLATGFDFLLKPIFLHGLSSVLHILLLVGVLVSWVWKRVVAGVGNGTKEEKPNSTLFKVTKFCCFGFSSFNFVLLLVNYFYWYTSGWSEERLVTLIDLGLKTVVWCVVCVCFHKGFLFFFSSSQRKRRFPVFFRAWCVFYLFVSCYCFVVDIVVLYENRVELTVRCIVSDVVSVCVGLFFYYVGFCVKNESGEEGDRTLQEPLLNGDTHIGNGNGNGLELKETKGGDTLTPYSNAGILSLLTFTWVGPLIAFGNKKILDLEDIPQLDSGDSVVGAFPAFSEKLEGDCGTINRVTSLMLVKSILISGWKEILFTAFLALLNTFASYVGPYLIDSLVQYLNGKRLYENQGYVLVSAFFLAKVVECLTQRHWFFRLQQLGLRIRGLLVTMIYKKTLTLSCQSRQCHTSGEIINFMTVDAERVGIFSWYMHDMWLVVLQVALALLILYKNLGPASIAAFVTTIIIMLANVPLGSLQEKFQKKLMESKDTRMKTTSEILRNMRILKLQGWEMKFLSKITELRDTEQGWLKKFVYTSAITTFVFWGAPTLVSVVTFGTCMVIGVPLESGKILSALATIRILQQPIYNLPDLISMIAQTKVSIDRIASFLRLEDLQSDVVERLSRGSSDTAIEVDDGNFSWDLSLPNPTLQNLNLKVFHGMKVAVCGTVGSGKSTLLSCLLGEVPKVSGTVKVCGTKAYVAQSPWIQSGKIEDNILFGEEMVRERYEKVLEACSLKKDLEILSFGDQTVIGERGINLSGGQKQRIQIARALYQDADIYLFDDPFSAVDAHTGSHLFKECLLGVLSSKTVVYVTHQVEFLPTADLILVMKDGKITQSGKYADLLNIGTDFMELVGAHREALSTLESSGEGKESNEISKLEPEVTISGTHEEVNKNEQNGKADDDTGEPKGQLVQDEERVKGKVGLSVYWKYITTAYGGALAPFIILAQILFQTLQIGSDYWMAWATPASADVEQPVNGTTLIEVYVGLAVGSALCILVRALLLVTFGYKTATILFNKMHLAIFRAPMSFFDSTPSGRILNRASTDQSAVDTDIPYQIGSFAFSLILLLGIIIVMSQVAWQVFIVFIPVIAISIYYQRFYLPSARELSRLCGVCKAPIIQHFAETISGTSTIRSFDQQSRFHAANMKLTDGYSRPKFNIAAAMEWLCIRLDMMSSITFVSSLMFLISIPPGIINPGLAGLAVTYGLNLNQIQAWVIWNICNLENKIISVERILQYTSIQTTSENNGRETSTQEKEKEKQETVSFHKLFTFADSTDILLMVVGTIGAVGNGLGLPLMTLLFGQMINSFGSNQSNTDDVVEQVSKVSLKFIYLAVGCGVAAFFQVSCWMVTGERQAARIRGLYLKTILRQDVAFFDKETNTGEVVGRMSGDTVLIQDAMGEKVGKFLQLIATFIGGFVIAFIKGWLLTLVMMSTLPLLAVSGAVMAVIIGKMASKGQTAYAKAAHVVEQTIGSIRTVASFTGEKQAVSNYRVFLVDAYKSGVFEGTIAGVGLGTVMFVIFCGYALAVWFGAKMIMEKGYNGGTVINVIIAVLTASMSLGQASPSLSAFAAGQAAAYKMFETIKRKPEIDAYDPNGKTLEDIQGEVELKEVYFSYPARPEELIFNEFSLHIPSGTTAALVGQSGSGKSTVISLVERFYDPQAGEVLIDGINMKEFQLRWIRGKIGLVSQEPVLFSSSIKDNIAYGKDGATIEEIRSASELANAAKFIDKLPQGLDTMVGDHGTQLSGGQKQRIAIARAILKNPRILLLDEATSALDAESERVVQEALDRIMVNRTTIVVAHRLSTIRNADMIAVIHRGKMVEKGTHSELLKDPEGAYSQLIRLQEVNRESDESTDNNGKRELSAESFRRSSQKKSLQRSISRGSSLGNSSRHSFSVSFGLPTGVNVTDPEIEDLPTKEKAQEIPLSRLASLNKPEIPVLLFGCLAAIGNGVILPIFGILISSIIKTFYEPFDEMKKDSKYWALMFMLLGFASLVVIPARGYFFSVAGCKLIERIRLICFEKVVSMEVGWFDEPENSSGAVGARLSADAASVRALVGDALGLLVQNLATALAGLIIAFVASWQLALIILVLIPLIGLNGYVQMKFMKGFSADAKMMYEEASQVANDAVGSIRTVASFCAEDKVMELYRKKCEGPMKTGIREGIISGTGFGVSFFLLFCVYATSFYAGARLVKAGDATFSDVFRVFFALTMAALGVSQSSSFAPDSSKAKSATASIFGMIDKKSKIDPSDESGTTLDNVKGEIELRHISFKYPSRPDIQIFRDLNLTIHSGKTVALVGESGSGKSTVISLLQRFYDPDSGVITLDGIEIRQLQLKWLRQQMGLVSQEPVLFNHTIRANIAYGKGGNATEAEIVAASELANAHRFISGLQQGYDTIVGERGTQLSGGQKQRVAIARAIIKSPKILLLDEATSALDAESERVVQDALDKVMVNRTTVVVAHRLSTIKNADVIAVVKNGVIVEKGRHETLINVKDGFYASLVQLHTSAKTV